MKKLMFIFSLMLLGMVSKAQIGSNDLIIQGYVTNSTSGLPVTNWPVTITGMGMTSTAYTNANGWYIDTISNGSVTGPNQLFFIETMNCDSLFLADTVSNNQGTVDSANVDFQICVQNQNTCQAAFNFYIDPTVAGNVIFENTSTTSDNIASFNWSLDGISISTTPVFSFIFPSNNGGLVCLTITSSTGCSDTYCQYVVPGSNATCLPYFNYQASANNALSYTFTNTTTTTGTNPTYYWYFGDGANSAQASPTHVFSQAGTYSVCLQVITDQCQNTMCQNITVVNDTISGNGCIASFNYVADSTTIQFNNTSYTPSQPVTFTWNFSDGTFSNELFPVHTFTTPGVYQVCLDMSTGSCSDSYCLPVYVGLPDSSITCNATIAYSYIGDVPNPSVFPYQFYSAYSGDNPEIIHVWTTSDGQSSNSYSPVFGFGPGTYTVCHSVTSVYGFCSDSTCTVVTIVPDTLNGCTAMFSAEISASATNEVIFTNLSSDLNASFIWQFGDGSPSEFGINATHTYAAPGSYPVNLNMTGNGCYDDYTFFVTITADNYLYDIGGMVFAGSNTADSAWVTLYSIDTTSFAAQLIQTVAVDSGFYVFQGVPIGTYIVKAGLNTTSAFFNDYTPTYFGSQYYWYNAQPIINTVNNYSYNISLIYGSNPGGNGYVGGSIDDGPFRLYNPEFSSALAPVAGAQIIVTDLSNVPQRWITADNNGNFNITDLAYGTYRLMADEPGMTCVPVEFTLSEATPGVDIALVMGDDITGIATPITSILQGDVYPNPASTQANLHIQLNDAARLSYSLVTVTGQLVWSASDNSAAGQRTLQIPVSGLSKGMYLLNVYGENGQLLGVRKLSIAH
jgi:PKD repeat protein